MADQQEAAALILAAGESRRLGMPKQRVRLGEETLLQRAVRIAGTLPIHSVHVVLGAHAAQCQSDLGKSPAFRHVNAGWRNGMGCSLAYGVGQIVAVHDVVAIMVLHVDQYRVRASDLARLLEAWRKAPEHATAAAFAGTVGAPAIFPGRLFAKLQEATDERGAKALLLQRDCRRIEMPAAAYDLDTPADLEILKGFVAQKA